MLAALLLITALGIDLPLLLSLPGLLSLLLVLAKLLLLTLPLRLCLPFRRLPSSGFFLLLLGFCLLLLAEEFSLARFLSLAVLQLLLLVSFSDLLHLLLMNKHLLNLFLLLQFDALKRLALLLYQGTIRGAGLRREAGDRGARALELAWRTYGVTHPAHLR